MASNVSGAPDPDVQSADTAELLRQLCEARGPSGFESEVRGIASERLGEHADEVRSDALGNLIALRRGSAGAESLPGKPRPSIMLTGHMDEIALIVSQIDRGFLRVASIGGFDPRVLLGQPVTVHAKRELAGIVVSVPPHFTDPGEREKPVPLDKLFVDVALPPAAVEESVRVGDAVTLRARFRRLAGGYACCKSMDDRAAIAAIVLCLEELERRRHAWDVYAVATVQEEVTGVGAVASAFHLEPTVAIAIDVTFGAQPGVSGPEAMKMDGGPTIALGPNIHPRVFERLTAAARSIELPFQVEPIPGSSGTDAWSIQVARSGVPTGLVGIPLRSMHSPVETVCLRDIERTAKLLAELVTRLEPAFAETLVVADAFEPAGPAAAAAGGAA
jgi:putative aminopeptidase FrvX